MLKRIKGFTLIELLIVVAIIAILAAIAVPNFLEAQTRSKVARVRSDLRSYATGIESYYIDNNTYPTQTSSEGDSPSANNIQNKGALLAVMPAFATFNGVVGLDGGSGQTLGHTLTTPVAYLTTHFADPFADTNGAIFNYSTSGQFRQGWIMWSYGPDTDQEVVNPQNASYQGSGTLVDGGGDIVIVEADVTVVDPSSGSATQAQLPFVEESYYNPGATVPSDALIEVTYDPTNGTTSNGDVYRLKQ